MKLRLMLIAMTLAACAPTPAEDLRVEVHRVDASGVGSAIGAVVFSDGPAGLKVDFLFDQSIFVRGAVTGVVYEGVIAGCLTGLMILLFLGSWRSTLIVATSIPLSILTSIIVLNILNQTLNVMTLGGLVLAVGILVDDATVEIENNHRHMDLGKPLRQAILDGAAEVATPAFVATLSICIVFVPILFLGGVGGALFSPLSMSVVFAMLASYFLSRTLVPTLALYLLAPEARGTAATPASEADLSLPATTQAIQDAIIYARTSGYISKRYVDIGDEVTVGQLLAEIESPEINQQLHQAQADLQQSTKNLDLQKAKLDLARVTMARYQAADKERAVAKEALDQSVSAYRTAQAAVAAAEANVASNKANIQRLQDLTSFQRVLAPFNGTVIQRNVDVGALITAGSPTNNTAVAPSSVTGGANGLFEMSKSTRFACSSTSPRPTRRT